MMNDVPNSYELPIDSEEARKLLNGIVVICDRGQEWYYYDETPPPPSVRPHPMPPVMAPDQVDSEKH